MLRKIRIFVLSVHAHFAAGASVQVSEPKEHLLLRKLLNRNGERNAYLKIVTTNALGIYTQLGMYKR